MNEDTFKRRMAQARELYDATSKIYFKGYMRGLRRFYYGEKFVIKAELQKYIHLDGFREDFRLGYLDGFQGNEPKTNLIIHEGSHREPYNQKTGKKTSIDVGQNMSRWSWLRFLRDLMRKSVGMIIRS